MSFVLASRSPEIVRRVSEFAGMGTARSIWGVGLGWACLQAVKMEPKEKICGSRVEASGQRGDGRAA